MAFAENYEDLPEAWHNAGQFYWGRKNAFLENKGVFTAKSYPVILPRHLVQDIDTPEDWDYFGLQQRRKGCRNRDALLVQTL